MPLPWLPRSGRGHLESKAAAQACYTPEWQATVTEKYGSPPEVLYVEVPVTVDNVANTIEST
ncbi:MAG: hypothetical protein QM766_11705 [Burkholderiaceae bacterium]